MSNGECKYKIVNLDFEKEEVTRECKMGKKSVCFNCECNCVSYEPKPINYHRLEDAIMNPRI